MPPVRGFLVVCLRFDLVEGGSAALDFGNDVLCGGFQMKGLGSVLQCAAHVVMASVSSATLVKIPRRRRLSVSSLNQRSTRFTQELEVGV